MYSFACSSIYNIVGFFSYPFQMLKAQIIQICFHFIINKGKFSFTWIKKVKDYTLQGREGEERLRKADVQT